MEIVVFQRSPMRLSNHSGLHNWDFSWVSSSCPQFPLFLAIPVDVQVSPETVIPTGLTPCIHLCRTFTMQSLRGLIGVIEIRYERMEVKMAAEYFQNCITLLLYCWFQSPISSIFSPF